MVPVDSVFNRFPRMIRDLAKSLDKKVDLVITGAETELDRTVIDEIGDPLVHLLRNAVDHGIESISDRFAAGKSQSKVRFSFVPSIVAIMCLSRLKKMVEGYIEKKY